MWRGEESEKEGGSEALLIRAGILAGIQRQVNGQGRTQEELNRKVARECNEGDFSPFLLISYQDKQIYVTSD